MSRYRDRELNTLGDVSRGRSRTSVPESGPDSLSAKSGGASLSQRRGAGASGTIRAGRPGTRGGKKRARARGAAGFEWRTRRGKHTERARQREARAPLHHSPRSLPRRERPPLLPHTHTGPRTSALSLPHTLSLVNPLRVPTDTDTTDTWFVTPVPRSGFPCALGSTDSCTTTVHMKPFSASVLQDPSGVFATTTKICTDGGSRQAHAHNPSTLTVATPLLLGTSAAGRTPKSPPPNLCRPRARYRHRAIAPPILRASCFGR